MRLFKRQRSCPKPESQSIADESQKSWAVFRFFQSSASGSKESAAMAAAGAAAAAAAAGIFPNESRRKQPHGTAADSLDDASPVNYNFINQNYTPEVALSPDSLPMSPAVLPLRQNSARHNNSGDTATAGGAKGKELERYQLWQQRKPRFHIGPRDQDDEDGGNGGRRVSASSTSTGASANLINLPSKYAFIYQDGKFVEREVTRWPQPQRALPHLRYRIQEPYATHYGRRFQERLACQERIVTQKERCIYHNPIFRLPRKVMEENKMRLMTRHCFKDCFEGPKTITGPQKISVNEQEQAKIAKKIVEEAGVPPGDQGQSAQGQLKVATDKLDLRSS